MIIKDFIYWKNETPSNSGMAVLINPNFYSLLNYRVAHFLYKKHVPFLSKILWFISRILYSIDIDYRAEIGKNFFISHGIGIVIGKNVKIGDNCRIYQQCTIGGNDKVRDISSKKFDMPIIKDNVVIYSHSILLGPIVVGEGAVVGAGTMVLTDVSSGVTVFNERKSIIR